MKTEHKYISYREDRNCYIVTVKINGENRQIIQRTCKTLEEAIEKRDAILALYKLSSKALSLATEKQKIKKTIPTLDEAFSEYVEKEIRPKVAISTYSKYNLCGRQYGKHLGNMKINEIKREVWQEVFTTMQTQKKLSYNYMIDDYRRLRAMYEYYITLNIIEENPLAKKIQLQLTHKTKRRAFTEEEKERFLASAWELHPEYHFIFSLYFQTGCRRGELLALQWRDIDYDNKKIYIRRNIGRGTVDGKFVEQVGQVKTEASIRTIPISDVNIKKFKALYLSRKTPQSPDDFVFQQIYHKIKYEFLSLNNIERAFTQIRDNAGLDRNLTIHCIRHTVASKLLTSGVDLATIQAIGGWSSPKTLLNVYAHSNEQSKEKAMEVLF